MGYSKKDDAWLAAMARTTVAGFSQGAYKPHPSLGLAATKPGVAATTTVRAKAKANSKARESNWDKWNAKKGKR